MQNPSDPAGQLDLNLDPDLGIELQYDLEGDTLREECGVFGIFGHPEAAAITALGLHALQHRGQEAAGIVSFDGTRFHSERRLGLVGDTFSRREVIERLPGNAAVGHVRYSTTGATILRNVQPLFAELNAGGFAVGHNGNLTNGLTLRRELVLHGAMMQSTTDTEVILHLVAQSKRSRFIDRFIEALRTIEGAYSLVSLTNKKLIGALDRTLGFLFGLARGLLIMVVAFLFFSWLVPDKQRPDWITGAKSRMVLQGTGDWLMSLLPDDPENTILKKFKKNKPDDDQTDTEQAAPASGDGYSKPARDGLKKLIEKPAGK